MSTRAEVRAAITAAVAGALPDAVIVDDPDPTRVVSEQSPKLFVQVLWVSTNYEPNQLLGAHQQSEHWTWEVQFLIPGSGPGALVVGEDAMSAVRDVLCPAAGFAPATDCDTLNLESEEWAGTTVQTGRALYVATYTHTRFL